MSESTSLLDLSRDELQEKLLQEHDPEKIKEIMNVFSLNLKKKEALRTNKLSDLQDKVFDQLDERLTKKPDNFSNTDLINYYKVFQDQISKADGSMEEMELPQIQINQQININQTEGQLTRESRQRVLDVVQSILQEAQSYPAVFEEVNNEEEMNSVG